MASRPSPRTDALEPRPNQPLSIKEIVFKEVMNGNWESVLDIYMENKENIQTASITSSKETVLHIAISDNRSDMAKRLVGIVGDGNMIKQMRNDQGNNPLHLAASLGQADMCLLMVDRDLELIMTRNMDGETPLFLAALHGRKEAFYTLHYKWSSNKGQHEDFSHCKRNDGNSILHVTILGEYFDLAFQIINWYPELAKFKNERGQSALHLLASHPSAFRSGCHFGLFIKDSMPRHFFAHLNNKRQTPKEVLTDTHRELVRVSGKWLTSTAESCSVVAALIATVAFASATTVPGGVKQDEGTPIFEGEPSFDMFAISSLVALCFSITSVTMFLSILTSRYQVWDFYYSLPSKLILGLSSLFVSIASILVSFCSGHFLSIRDKLKFAVFPIYAFTCLPLTLFAVAQFPLYLDLIRSIMAPVPKRSLEVTSI
ncbi:hypothetical protein MRB53_009218 [Persea americana]|uniref:Uncharacterized protein n=1 Tax=Persea americana TaxID=3435 RepID=A0ACC2LNG1_PERAE|nr:hypothetical protein MRB53_009218 [Persea americana]